MKKTWADLESDAGHVLSLHEKTDHLLSTIQERQAPVVSVADSVVNDLSHRLSNLENELSQFKLMIDNYLEVEKKGGQK